MAMVNSTMHLELGSPEFPLTGRQSHSSKDYERELTGNRAAGLRPHSELAVAKAQLRQKDELVGQLKSRLTQYEQVLSKLLALQQGASERLAGLTRRQREIVKLILAGCPNKDIANNLGISQRTVESHRASIMKKTSSKSLPALARVGFVASWDSDGQALFLHQTSLSQDLRSTK
jgi:DNA-binding CsgD family transcriptional regulator